MAASTEIQGMRELERTLRQLEQLPQKCVTKAARQGANFALKAAKKNAPEDEGYLKKSLKLIGERANVKGKKVYQIAPDRAYNDVFQGKSNQVVFKYNRRTKQMERRNKTSYYPASQEYGFMARNGRYIPGYHYLKKAIDENERQIQEKTVDVLANEIDKLG